MLQEPLPSHERLRKPTRPQAHHLREAKGKGYPPRPAGLKPDSGQGGKRWKAGECEEEAGPRGRGQPTMGCARGRGWRGAGPRGGRRKRLRSHVSGVTWPLPLERGRCGAGAGRVSRRGQVYGGGVQARVPNRRARRSEAGGPGRRGPCASAGGSAEPQTPLVPGAARAVAG